jgi:MoxR-like ATPase
VDERLQEFAEHFGRVKGEVLKHIVGYDDLVEKTMLCLFADGHVLLEGLPGLGKTKMLHSLSQTIDASFARIQFTPDLMPADIIGTNIIMEGDDGKRDFRFHAGPVFNQIVLADEINRATPKTQSALLEAMQERTVSVGGKTRELGRPFFVLGTQNPIEMEGTYPLPEAQVDRFMFKLHVPHLGEDSLVEVIRRTQKAEPLDIKPVIRPEDVLRLGGLAREVLVAEHVNRYAVRIARATHADDARAPELTRKYVKYGASPRGIQAMVYAGKVKAILSGRANLSEEDVRFVAKPALRHRILLNFEGEADGVRTDSVVDAVLENIT